MRVTFTLDLLAIPPTLHMWRHGSVQASTKVQIGLTASIDALAEGVFDYPAVRLEKQLFHAQTMARGSQCHT
jgi:hypothetical protein